MMRRTVGFQVGLWVLLGALFPVAAHSLDGELETSTRPDNLLQRLIDGAAPRSVETAVSIEEQVQFEAVEAGAVVGDGLTREYTFTGSENDLIVVYWESSDEENRGVYAELYDDAGQLIEAGRNYEKGTDFSEFRGRHRTFLLPQSGSYRLVFGAYGDDGFATDPSEGREYLLRVRVATEYDQVMVSASEAMKLDSFEEAVAMFSQAIAQRPGQPLPYFGRMFAQAGLVQEAAGLTENDVRGPEDLYKLYQAMDVETQQQVLSDLQQVEAAIVGVMESEKLTEEDLELDVELFGAIAQYFKTGEQPEYFDETAPQAEVLETR